MFQFLLQLFSRKQEKLVDTALPHSFHINIDADTLHDYNTASSNSVNTLPKYSRKITGPKEVPVDNSGIFNALIASQLYDAVTPSSSYSDDSFSGSGGDFGGGGSSGSWDSS
jgi:hypothetical protein